jgi:protein involved in ribonucleotide reduction
VPATRSYERLRPAGYRADLTAPTGAVDVPVVYYSTKSGNTRRFARRLGFSTHEITSENRLQIDGPYILVIPTYNGRVPTPVLRFLERAQHRTGLQGVAVGGSSNFGSDFGAAGRIISQEYGVPLLHVFELTGLPEDITTLQHTALTLWNNLS